MTLLHHLSAQHFSSPKALVTKVTDGDSVCVYVFFMRVYAHMCVQALVYKLEAWHRLCLN